MNNIGFRTEDLIQKICTRMFFSDFTVRSPKYKKKDGQLKEAADFLIAFKDMLIVFQVKSKLEKKSADKKTVVDFKRIERKVQEGVKQFKAIKEVIASDAIKSLRTVKGLNIPFQSTQIKKIIGVVILDLIGEERFPKDKRTGIFNGFTIEREIPIHIFMREDFEEISEELDTLPDFLRYLNIRETLSGKRAISFATNELDFLAIFKTKWPLIEDLLSGKTDFISIDNGIWDSYQKRQSAIQERNKKNFPSYWVDEIIKWMYSSLGFEIKSSFPSLQSCYPQGSMINYIMTITELASFDRLKRRTIGQALLEKAKKADTFKMGYRALIEPQENTAVVVFSLEGSRQERIDKLYKLCVFTYCKHNLRKIIGISTEPSKVKFRSYDCIVFDGVSFANSKEIVESGKRLFGTSRHFREEEY